METLIRHRRDLYKVIGNVKDAHIAECGAAESFFAAEMAAWGVEKIYVVDMWESHGEFPGDAGNPQNWHDKNYEASLRRLAPFGDAVVILRGPTTKMSEMVPDGSLDLVNIDACHSYQCVKNDIAAWWPKLKKNGIMSFHDYEAPQYGVKKAVTEFAYNTYPGLAQENYGIFLLPEDKLEDAGAYIIKR